MFARTDSPTVFFPPGTYMLSCAQHWIAASAISMIGASASTTTIKFPSACTIGGDAIFFWDAKSGVRVSELTFDQNNAVTSVWAPGGGSGAILAMFAYTGNVNYASIDHVRIINSPGDQYITMYAVCCGYVFENGHMDDNYIHSQPAYSPNQCLSTTTVERSGTMRYMTMNRNICVGSAIQADGDNFDVSYNDISNFNFGTGIFGPSAGSSKYHSYIGNKIHDSGWTSRDTSGILIGGVEVPHNSIVCDNMFWNLGGIAINNFGFHNLICNNIAWNNNNAVPTVSPPISEAEKSAFHTPLSGGSKAGTGARYVGNKAYDTRGASARQLYGYFDWAGDAVPGITFSGNEFHGYLGGKAYAIGMGTNGDPNPVSMQDWVTLDRQVKYRVAAIEFTNIDPSFLHYNLTCSGLGPYPNGKIKMQFGTSTGPTWLAGATDYVTGGTYQSFANATPTTFLTAGMNAMTLTDNLWGVTYGSNTGNLFTAHFAALGYPSSGLYTMRYEAGYGLSTGWQEISSGFGYTSINANPITAIRLFSPDAGAINGNCVLQGIL